MLVGTPLPVKLSVFFRALGPPLWIRRVLVGNGGRVKVESCCPFRCRLIPVEPDLDDQKSGQIAQVPLGKSLLHRTPDPSVGA